MEHIKEVDLPSGSKLRIYNIPIDPATELVEAFAAELKMLKLDTSMTVTDLFKDALCSAISSPQIKQRIFKCMSFCTYDSGNGEFKIDKSTFEPLNARKDYLFVMFEVGKETIGPFTNDLALLFSKISELLGKSPA